MDELLQLACVGSRKDPEEQRKLMLLVVSTCMLGFFSTIQLVISFWIEVDWLNVSSICDCINILFYGLILFLCCRAKVNLKLACTIFCVEINVCIFVAGLYHSEDVRGWFCFVPLFACYVFGSKVGLLYFFFSIIQGNLLFWMQEHQVVLPPLSESKGSELLPM